MISKAPILAPSKTNHEKVRNALYDLARIYQQIQKRLYRNGEKLQAMQTLKNSRAVHELGSQVAKGDLLVLDRAVGATCLEALEDNLEADYLSGWLEIPIAKIADQADLEVLASGPDKAKVIDRINAHKVLKNLLGGSDE